MDDERSTPADPWRAAQARRAAGGGGGFTAPTPDPDATVPDDAHVHPPPAGPGSGWPSAEPAWPAPPRPPAGPAAVPADWYAPPSAPAPAPAPAPPDGLPGLPASGPTITWEPADEDVPGPGRAAPGRHGWARTEGSYVPSMTDKGATLSIVLGVLGLVFCGILLGPAAIVEGVKARRRILSSGGGLTGEARAIVGIVVGSVATFIGALGILALVLAAAIR